MSGGVAQRDVLTPAGWSGPDKVPANILGLFAECLFSLKRYNWP